MDPANPDRAALFKTVEQLLEESRKLREQSTQLIRRQIVLDQKLMKIAQRQKRLGLR